MIYKKIVWDINGYYESKQVGKTPWWLLNR